LLVISTRPSGRSEDPAEFKPRDLCSTVELSPNLELSKLLPPPKNSQPLYSLSLNGGPPEADKIDASQALTPISLFRSGVPRKAVFRVIEVTEFATEVQQRSAGPPGASLNLPDKDRMIAPRNALLKRTNEGRKRVP
jgi:hypothetical protein